MSFQSGFEEGGDGEQDQWRVLRSVNTGRDEFNEDLLTCGQAFHGAWDSRCKMMVGHDSHSGDVEKKRLYVPGSHLKPAVVHFTFAFVTFKRLKLVALSNKTGINPLLCSNEDRGLEVNMALRSRAGGTIVFSLAGRRGGDLEFKYVMGRSVCAFAIQKCLCHTGWTFVIGPGLCRSSSTDWPGHGSCHLSAKTLIPMQQLWHTSTPVPQFPPLRYVIPQELRDKIVDFCAVVDLPSLCATCMMFHLHSTIRLFEEVIVIGHRMSRSQHTPAKSMAFFFQHPFLQVFPQRLIFQDGEFDVKRVELLMQMLENVTDIRLENSRRLSVCSCAVDSLSMQKLLLSIYRLQYLVISACTFHDVPQTIVFPSTLMSCILDLDGDLGEAWEFVRQWGIRAPSWRSLSFWAKVPSIIEEMITWVFESRGAHWHTVVPLVGCHKLRGLGISCAECNVDTMTVTLTTLPEVRLKSLCLNLHLVNQPTFPGDVTQVEFRALDRVIENLFQAGRLRYVYLAFHFYGVQVIPDEEVYLLYAEQHAHCFPMLSSRRRKEWEIIIRTHAGHL
ncbi:hypothetical protein EDD85DRAFT_793787 [Armillaria nabsnona]|nr:hypothetical protein EDD85DRAFT_793787 [Armillaria nabsnona]